MFASDDLARRGRGGGGSLDEVAAVTPVLQNTELGAGRNKLFIRGIADSSFNGPTQATASVYFGDVQLGYSGPDPALRLYDVDRIEILEGPQGTLYGAGAIGGIIRITPKPVDLGRNGGAAEGGVTLTRGGGTGYDLDTMLNLVVAEGRAGVRGVAYRTLDAGYIDDAARGARDVNSRVTAGGRVAAALKTGGGWSIEAGALLQTIGSVDAQYADRDAGALVRRSAFAQPYRSRVALGRLVVGRTWDSGVQLASSTGLVGYRSREVFDATRNRPGSAPMIYANANVSRLLTHETRVSRTLPNGSSWLVGGAILHALNEQSRALGPVGDPATIIGVTNRTTSVSAFTEATLAFGPELSFTAGGRLTRARIDGEPSTTVRNADFVRGRSSLRVDPTIGVSGLLAPDLAAYVRYQSGFRTGGLAVARGVGRVADFRSDAIHVIESGLRLQPAGARAPSLSAGLSFARWRNIQADLVDRRGLPYTANIGQARIFGLETSGRWSPVADLEASFSALYTSNAVSGPLANSSRRRNRRLPETPAFSGTARLGYHWAIAKRDRIAVAAEALYVGRSVLGTGDFFDISQGRYTVANLSATWTRGAVTASLALDNVGNAGGNRFALGNPFLLATRSQSTPLVPMRLRAGLAVGW